MKTQTGSVYYLSFEPSSSMKTVIEETRSLKKLFNNHVIISILVFWIELFIDLI